MDDGSFTGTVTGGWTGRSGQFLVQRPAVVDPHREHTCSGLCVWRRPQRRRLVTNQRRLDRDGECVLAIAVPKSVPNTQNYATTTNGRGLYRTTAEPTWLFAMPGSDTGPQAIVVSPRIPLSARCVTDGSPGARWTRRTPASVGSLTEICRTCSRTVLGADFSTLRPPLPRHRRGSVSSRTVAELCEGVSGLPTRGVVAWRGRLS